MQPGTLAFSTCVVCLLGLSGRARAEAPGFAVNRFEPSARGSDWFVNESLDLRGVPSIAAGLVAEWSYKSLPSYAADRNAGPALGYALTDQIVLHSGVSVHFHDSFRVAVNLPVAVYQSGDEPSGVAAAVPAASKASVGDLRLSGDVRLFGEYGDAFTTALGLQIYLPTGSPSLLTSDGTLRFTPRVLIAGDAAGFVYAAKLGFGYRPRGDTFAGRKLGSEAIFSVAAGVRVNDIFVFGPELSGSTVVTREGEPFSTRATPLELLLGGHLTLANDWLVGSGIGPGFTRADGTPSMRVAFSVEFAPDACVDPDGDGICAPFDACPGVDGPRTNQRSSNGCPGDRDHDGIGDAEDACLETPGLRYDEPHRNGCPRETDESPAPR